MSATGQRLALLRAALKEHESRQDEIEMAASLARNHLRDAAEFIEIATDSVMTLARLQREHHDLLVASVIKALNQEIG